MQDPLNEELLLEYAALKTLEKETAEKIKQKSPLVLAELTRAGVDKVQKKGVGSFSLGTFTKYEYSEAVQAAEGLVVEMKEKEKQLGTAKPIETRIIKFVSEKIREEVEA